MLKLRSLQIVSLLLKRFRSRQKKRREKFKSIFQIYKTITLHDLRRCPLMLSKEYIQTNTHTHTLTLEGAIKPISNQTQPDKPDEMLRTISGILKINMRIQVPFD